MNIVALFIAQLENLQNSPTINIKYFLHQLRIMQPMINNLSIFLDSRLLSPIFANYIASTRKAIPFWNAVISYIPTFIFHLRLISKKSEKIDDLVSLVIFF